MRQLLLVSTVVVAACAGRTAATSPPPPTPAVRVRYQPATVRYHAAEYRHVEQVFQGQSITTDLTTELVLSAVLAATDSGFAATITVDSIAVTGQAAYAPGSVAAARGARFTALLDPSGAVRHLTAPDESSDLLLQQLAAGFKEFFPRLPQGGARPGDQWTDTTETSTPAGTMAVTVRSRNTHSAIGWAQIAGASALELATRSDYVITGSGTQMGQALTLDGAGRRHAQQFLAADGRYLGGTAADSASIQVHLVASGMTLPMVQQSVDTIAVVQ